MLRGPERFFRSGERARARGLDPGHESRPDLHSLLALQLRVGVVARSPADLGKIKREFPDARVLLSLGAHKSGGGGNSGIFDQG